MDYRELAFQEEMVADLVGAGRRVAEGTPAYAGLLETLRYARRSSDDYDPSLCLDVGVLVDFIIASQPEEWARYARRCGASEAPASLAKRLAEELAERGPADVLRKGIKDRGHAFELAIYPPSSGLNAQHARQYALNTFTVVTELQYDRDVSAIKHRLDVVLFLNGIPLFTMELKNHLTGQTAEDAKKQYCTDRDPRQPLLSPGRCIAHFAVDPEDAWFTTVLNGGETRFLPFNKGFQLGKGNPPCAAGYATAYLWQEVLAPESVLNLVQNYVLPREDKKGQHRASRGNNPIEYVFPRYHQLDAVRRLLEDTRSRGAGGRYLVQHSAGSGKTYTIAWLAHQLASLYDSADRKLFDSVVVITDRRVLDDQMQDAVRTFSQVRGVVACIDQDSKQLGTALEQAKPIIVSTLQKFPFVYTKVKGLQDRRFAVIIDEAHSSQGGDTARKMIRVLHGTDSNEDSDPTWEDAINETLSGDEGGGTPANLSLYAFTATPQASTLMLFGTPREDGRYEPFSLYSMRQAIEEGFILDVLDNYITYRAFWSLLKQVEGDPRYERDIAKSTLVRWAIEHPELIEQKARIMVNHFDQQVRPLLDGQARGMIVTRSRLAAVRYKQAVDAILREQGLPWKALVAFSDTVEDPETKEKYSEASMNSAGAPAPIPDTATADTFNREPYRMLIVASKFQTGFDQPLLSAMYVDRQISGLQAVQTLSRLNRIHAGKTGTVVVDFQNDPERIRESFQPYYQATILSMDANPNDLYTLERQLLGAGYFSAQEVERVGAMYRESKTRLSRLYAVLDPVIERYEAADEEDQAVFRGQVVRYMRLYALFERVMDFYDAGLENLYEFCRLLIKRMPVGQRRAIPMDILRQVDLRVDRIDQKTAGRIALSKENGELNTSQAGSVAPDREQEKVNLSAIIADINKRFGIEGLDDATSGYVSQMVDDLSASEALRNALDPSVNPADAAWRSFEEMFQNRLQASIDDHLQVYRTLTRNADYQRAIADAVFLQVRKRMGDAARF